MKFMVAFSSPKRSARTVETAAAHAKALDAELILLRVIPDPNKVGVVAQLIATDRPVEKAREAGRNRRKSVERTGHKCRVGSF